MNQDGGRLHPEVPDTIHNLLLLDYEKRLEVPYPVRKFWEERRRWIGMKDPFSFISKIS